MGVSKVIFYGETLVDMTQVTVAPETLGKGETALDASGNLIVGTLESNTTVFAIIKLTYPAGATATCKKGTTTLTAPDTSGNWMIVVPEAGTWTVTATQGSSTKSQNVNITTMGQVETVSISFELVLFNNGALASGYSIAGGTYISPAIDMSQYTQMEVTAGCYVASAGAYFPVGVTANPSMVSYSTKPTAYLEFPSGVNGSSTTKTLSLSSINTSMYVGFWTAIFGAGNFSINSQYKTIYFKESAYSEYYISKIVLR